MGDTILSCTISYYAENYSHYSAHHCFAFINPQKSSKCDKFLFEFTFTPITSRLTYAPLKWDELRKTSFYNTMIKRLSWKLFWNWIRNYRVILITGEQTKITKNCQKSKFSAPKLDEFLKALSYTTTKNLFLKLIKNGVLFTSKIQKSTRTAWNSKPLPSLQKFKRKDLILYNEKSFLKSVYKRWVVL